MAENLHSYYPSLLDTFLDTRIVNYCNGHRLPVPLAVLEDHETRRAWLITCVDELLGDTIFVAALVKLNSELWMLGVALVVLGLCRKSLGRRGEEGEATVYFLARVRSVGIVILCLICVEAMLGMRMLWYIWIYGWEMWALGAICLSWFKVWMTV